MQPTYRLLDGSVGNSYAIEISKHLGLNQDIIQHAFIIKDESMTTSQKLLEKLQSELSAVLQEKEALEKLQKETADKENGTGTNCAARYKNHIEKHPRRLGL